VEKSFIDGGQIYLRELRLSDVEQGNWYSWFNDPEVTTFQNKGIFPNTREAQKKYFDQLGSSSKDVVLAIIEKESNLHIGNVGLHNIDWVHRSAELGIVLGERSAWGKRYGKKAWQMITDYGMYTLNLRRIFAQIMEGNIASCKSAEAAGFKREGVIREVYFKNGKYINLFYYNLLKSDLK
jgi:ribosomal-protein-alanine N-acetyltransferase